MGVSRKSLSTHPLPRRQFLDRRSIEGLTGIAKLYLAGDARMGVSRKSLSTHPLLR